MSPKDDSGPRTPFSAPGGARRRSRAMTWAAGLAAAWVVSVAAYAIGFFGLFGEALLAPRPAAALEIALFLLAAIAPPALFFYAAQLADKAEEIRRETARLTSAVDALRHTTTPRNVPAADELAAALTAAARDSLAEEKQALAAALARIDESLSETRALVEELRSADPPAKPATDDAPPPKSPKKPAEQPPPDAAQPPLPLGPAPAPKEIPWDNVVRALDFPKNERDRDGFAALQSAVKDREFADLLQAAEDALTMLSHNGIYMEDMAPALAPLDLWVRYAEGARGKQVDAIGGVTDDAVLDKVQTRLKRDTVFRDAALHFLRRFDRLLERMLRELGEDERLIAAGDSRTGRAFMVVARVMGVFDRA